MKISIISFHGFSGGCDLCMLLDVMFNLMFVNVKRFSIKSESHNKSIKGRTGENKAHVTDNSRELITQNTRNRKSLANQ